MNEVVKKINWAVLGCARIAKTQMIPAIQKAQNARLYAIAGRDASRLQEFQELFEPEVVYNSYQELLEDGNVEVVYIPLPNYLHLEWVKKAAAHKKHILCEKPLGLTAEQVAEMQVAAQENSIFLFEGFAYRYSPMVQKVIELVNAGAIGKLKMIHCHLSFPIETKDDYRLKRVYGGGSAYDIGCYNYDFMRILTDKMPLQIHSAAILSDDTEVDISGTDILIFEDNVTGISTCGMDQAQYEAYRVIGEAGIIEVLHDYNAQGELTLKLGCGDMFEEIKVNCPDNYMLEVQHVSDCILGLAVPEYTLKDSYQTALILDEIQRQIGDMR